MNMSKNYFTDEQVKGILKIWATSKHNDPIKKFKNIMNLAVEEAIGDVVAEVKFMSVDGDSRIGGVLWYGNKYNTPINTPLYSVKELEN